MTRSAGAILVVLALALPARTTLAAASRAPATVPVLLLSDIHFDPYSDPAKAAALNAAPVSQWNSILAGKTSLTQPQDIVALRQACPVRGVDTSNVLFQSSLAAIEADAGHSRFVTISGDLLAHQFDCKYRTLLPAATHASYLSFVEKTIEYVLDSVHAKLPGVPIYTALGNNDSGCTDYALEPAHDKFLERTAAIVASAAEVTGAERAAIETDFAKNGSYSAPLAGIPRTRIVVLDDLYSSGKYMTCAGKPDPAPAAAELAWLQTQLDAARQHNEHVWVMGHIPPGVDLYSTARKLINVCAGGKPQMFLGSESLAGILAHNSDVVRLALFGHTHSDEMRLLTVSAAELTGTGPVSTGVPLKIVASITPVNGNRPTFTLAAVNPAMATLVDYTVMMASNLAGIDTTWTPEYTYSTTYRQPAFDSASLSTLIAGFQADPSADTPASQAYLRSYYPGDASSLIEFAWPQYACSLNHDSAADFKNCVCAAAK